MAPPRRHVLDRSKELKTTSWRHLAPILVPVVIVIGLAGVPSLTRAAPHRPAAGVAPYEITEWESIAADLESSVPGRYLLGADGPCPELEGRLGRASLTRERFRAAAKEALKNVSLRAAQPTNALSQAILQRVPVGPDISIAMPIGQDALAANPRDELVLRLVAELTIKN